MKQIIAHFNHHKRLYVTGICLLGLNLSMAQGLPDNKLPLKKDSPERSPLGCKNSGYRFKLKTLDLLPVKIGDDQALYFMFNRLSKPVHLYQMLRDDNSHNLYLNHEIKPQQWSVLAAGEKQFKYVCTVDDPSSSFGKVVDCKDSIKVCEYARVKFGLNNRGNFWMVGSSERNSAVRAVVNYGIIPR